MLREPTARTRPRASASARRPVASSGTGGALLVARLIAITTLNYSLSLALAWLLAPEEFAHVAILQAVLWLSAIALNSGFPWTLAWTAAQTRGVTRKQQDEATRTALLGNLALGIVGGVAIVLLGLGDVIWPTGGSPALLLVAASCLPFFAVNSTFRGALQGRARFREIAFFQTAEVVVKFGVAVVLVVAFGAGAGGLAVGFLAGAVAATGVAAWLGRDLIPDRGPLAPAEFVTRTIPMFGGAVGFALLVTIDLLSLRAFHSVPAATIALYQVAAIIARAPYFVSDALTDAGFPFIARARTSTKVAEKRFREIVRRLVYVVIPLELVLILRPEAILELAFPNTYANAVVLIRILAIGGVGAVATNAFGKALQARAQRRTSAYGVLLGVGVEIVLLGALLPTFGATGAAVAFAVASWVAAISLAIGWARTQNTNLLVARWPSRFVVPLAAFSCVLLFPVDQSEGVRLLQIVAAALIYAYALLLVGAVPKLRVFGVVIAPPGTAAARVRWLARMTVNHPAPAVALVGICTFLFETINLSRSPDTIYDEAVYTTAAQNVALHGTLTWTGAPLFVHPPLFFLLQAGWLRLAGVAGDDYFTVLHAERLLTTAAMAGCVALLMLFTLRLTYRGGAVRRVGVSLTVAALAAVDPFMLRYGRLDMLESTALFTTLFALYSAWTLRARTRLLWVLVVGPLSGLALLTKEISIFLLAVPLLYAALTRSRRLAGNAVAALAVGIALWSTFVVWALLLGEGGRFFADKLRTFDRLVGIVQTTGWNRPGVSLLAGLTTSLSQYASSYLILSAGIVALLVLWLRRSGAEAMFLTAWLLATYALGLYTVSRGQLNEQFFTYLMPGAIVATVVVGDIAASAFARRLSAPRRARGLSNSGWLAGAAAVVIAASLIGGVVNWGRFYAFGRDDGVRRMSGALALGVPSCAVINATGDPQKFAAALNGHRITRYASGPRALSHGVHYFLLSPKDVIARYTNMTPEFATWIRSSGSLVRTFPSHTYRGLELWRVDSSAFAQLADVQRVRRGIFVNSAGSACGGYAITNQGGRMLDLYVSFGGKSMLGPPLSRPWAAGVRKLQLFGGAVLSVPAGFTWAGRHWGPHDERAFKRRLGLSRSAFARWARTHNAAAQTFEPHPRRTLPVVQMLARRRPALVRKTALPFPTVAPAADWAKGRELLRDRSIAAFYLGGRHALSGRWPAALRRYGSPLGPPRRMPDGMIRQPFEGVILERSPGSTHVRFASIGPLVKAANLVPAAARRPLPVPHLDVGPPRVHAASGIASFVVLAGGVLALLALVLLAYLLARLGDTADERLLRVEKGAA
ncbi:MAG: polysaccharide biosynthesis C-terminal domain-containing protein [Gaiellaceae bacterium]